MSARACLSSVHVWLIQSRAPGFRWRFDRGRVWDAGDGQVDVGHLGENCERGVGNCRHRNGDRTRLDDGFYGETTHGHPAVAYDGRTSDLDGAGSRAGGTA